MNGFIGRMVSAFCGLLFSAATFSMLGAASAAFADEGASYYCEFDSRSRFDNLLPEAVGFVVGSDDGGTLVFDPIINNYYNEPIEAKLLVDNDARVSIRWVVKAIFVDNGRSRKFQYDLTLMKGQLTARLTAKLAEGKPSRLLRRAIACARSGNRPDGPSLKRTRAAALLRRRIPLLPSGPSAD